MNNFEYGVWQRYSGYDSHVVIPWGIRVIAPYCFKWCAQLTSVVLPETMEKISRRAFAGCMSLTHITLKNHGAIVFEKDWFYQCDNLCSIHAPGVPFVSFKSDIKPLALRGFIENPSVFPDARKAEYIKYMTGQKKRLLTAAIVGNDVAMFKAYEQFNVKIPSELCDELIGLAAMEQKTEVQAWLMDYKNRTVDRKTEAKEKARTDEQQLDNPYMAKFLKAEWSWSKLDDGTIRIDRYKGEATDVTIPPFVGNVPVTTVGAFIFNVKRSNGKHVPNENIQNVIVPENIKCIEANAFFKCIALQTISLPETITAIGAHAFRGCCQLKPLIASAAVRELASKSNAYATNLKNVTVVVSGDLRMSELRNGKWYIRELTHDEMAAFITEFGGVMTTSVSSKTTCLISNDPHSNSAKVRKAKELGTPILFLSVFFNQYFPEGISE